MILNKIDVLIEMLLLVQVGRKRFHKYPIKNKKILLNVNIIVIYPSFTMKVRMKLGQSHPHKCRSITLTCCQCKALPDFFNPYLSFSLAHLVIFNSTYTFYYVILLISICWCEICSLENIKFDLTWDFYKVLSPLSDKLVKWGQKDCLKCYHQYNKLQLCL